MLMRYCPCASGNQALELCQHHFVPKQVDINGKLHGMLRAPIMCRARQPSGSTQLDNRMQSTCRKQGSLFVNPTTKKAGPTSSVGHRASQQTVLFVRCAKGRWTSGRTLLPNQNIEGCSSPHCRSCARSYLQTRVESLTHF